MTKTQRKYDKDTKPWRDILTNKKSFLERKQEEQEAEDQIRDAKWRDNNKDKGED